MHNDQQASIFNHAEAANLSKENVMLKEMNTRLNMISTLLYNMDERRKVDILSTEEPYTWKPWDTPIFTERLKKSYYILQDYFSKLK